MAWVAAVRQRYDWLARVYDQITLDRLVYGAARRRAVELLHLQPGDVVLDLGCGTGLSLEHLRRKVGPEGAVVGVDLSPGMLQQAHRRVQRAGWRNVHLLQGDLTELSPDLWADRVDRVPAAALFALSLSVVPDPPAVLRSAAALVAPGGCVAVMDAGVPPGPSGHPRLSRLAIPVWHAVFRLAHADASAHPWTAVPDAAPHGATSETFHLGFVRVAAGHTSASGTASRPESE